MAKLIEKKPHPNKPSGFILKFDNGHEYSVIDLSEPFSEEAGPKRVRDAYEKIGETYDKLGGRFEAILLPDSESGSWGDPIRAHDFESLIEMVKQEEES